MAIILLATFISSCTSTNYQAKHKPQNAGLDNIRLGYAYLEKKDVPMAKKKFLLAVKQAPKLPEAR